MSKFKTIAFPTGGIIPADQAKKKTEQRPGPHVPVDVVAEYADYLVGDRLAYEWNKETAPPAPADTSAEALLVAARTEAQRLIDEAKSTAATEKDRILGEAASEKQRIADQAMTDADEIRAAAKRDAETIGADEKKAADGLIAEAKAEAAAKGGAGKSSGDS